MTSITTILGLLCFVASVTAEDYSVIIIGAGPSGVAAAAKLLENNITDILILEAEPRIGGRIHSVYFGDAYVELGAQWCHGKTNNIVYKLASPLVPLREDNAILEIVYSAGELEENFRKELEVALLEEFYKEADSGNFTMQDFNIANLEARVRNTYSNDPEKLRIALLVKRLLEQYILSYEGAFYLTNVTSKSDFVFGTNDSNYAWQGIGYKTILDILIHKYPDPAKALTFHEKLKLNEEATKIQWSQHGVVVETNNGGASYRAKRLVFTPSLNVLKQQHEQLFAPKLPTFKLEALQDLGMDAVMKVHAGFAARWWPESNFTGYSFLWDENSLQEAQESSHSWITNICCIIPADRNPKVLTAWITGPEVPKIEPLSDEEISRGLVVLLKKFIGNKFNVTNPQAILKSGWYNNPHFRGVYSYQTPKAYLRDPSPEIVLSEPVKSGDSEFVLFFAGEATHPHFYSTVHGAIDSGFREAERIIQLIKK